MSIFDAIILGIVQGISEFLPISSTAHLTFSGKIMGLISEANPKEWTEFMAVIQLGTLAAVLVYFFSDLVNIAKAFITEAFIQRKRYGMQSTESKLGWLIIAGSIPIAVLGLSFKHIIEGPWTKNLWVLGVSMLVMAVVLAIAEKTARFKKNIEDITVLDSVLIGVAQAFALIPGSSRSGTSITGALFCGLKRDVAARFSFLLSIPAVFASGLLEFKQSLPLNHDKLVDMGVATLVSAVVGYMAIDFLLKYLRNNSTFVFIWYRVMLGIVILSLLYFGTIQP